MSVISTAISIIIAILIFGIVVLVHEWGHFIAARRGGIFVEEFAIGMGPKLLATKGGENKTVYSLRLFPIGGFCKMLGEDADSADSRAVNSKSVPRRIAVMSAGAGMNFLLAFVIFLVLSLLVGYTTTRVRTPIDGMPAQQAGLTDGDIITHLNGTRVYLYEDFIFELSGSGGKPVTLRYIRDGQQRSTILTPQMDANGDYKIGVYMEGQPGWLSNKPEGETNAARSALAAVGRFFAFIGNCIVVAFHSILFYIKMTVVGLIRLITRKAGLADMSGPIGIVGVIDETYRVTIAQSVLSTVLTMANFCALLSANLGVFNLLPVPALDGGRLIFLFVEGIRRKPVSPEREGMVHFVGFVLLMVLAVFVAYNDIMKLL